MRLGRNKRPAPGSTSVRRPSASGGSRQTASLLLNFMMTIIGAAAFVGSRSAPALAELAGQNWRTRRLPASCPLNLAGLGQTAYSAALAWKLRLASAIRVQNDQVLRPLRLPEGRPLSLVRALFRFNGRCSCAWQANGGRDLLTSPSQTHSNPIQSSRVQSSRVQSNGARSWRRWSI